MAVNATPQYRKAEEEYRRASTPDEQIRWLEEMLKELPKHKASEKVQMDLKSRISRLRKEMADAPKSGGKAGVSVKIPRQGAGTALLIGPPNSGKSSLLAALTRATPEIADYPFTTRNPLPGMMPWEDVMIQLIDTPPITADVMEPYLQGLIRGADAVLLVVDLGNDDGIESLSELWTRLEGTKTRLARESGLDDEDVGLSYTQTILVGNKADDADAKDRLALLHELVPLDLPEMLVSAQTKAGLDELKAAVFQALGVMRIYTKSPKDKEPDYEKPFTLPFGSTVYDLAGLVHKDVQAKLKSGRVWGHGVHDGETVKPDHELHDRDVVELHTA